MDHMLGSRPISKPSALCLMIRLHDVCCISRRLAMIGDCACVNRTVFELAVLSPRRRRTMARACCKKSFMSHLVLLLDRRHSVLAMRGGLRLLGQTRQKSLSNCVKKLEVIR